MTSFKKIGFLLPSPPSMACARWPVATGGPHHARRLAPRLWPPVYGTASSYSSIVRVPIASSSPSAVLTSTRSGRLQLSPASVLARRVLLSPPRQRSYATTTGGRSHGRHHHYHHPVQPREPDRPQPKGPPRSQELYHWLVIIKERVQQLVLNPFSVIVLVLFSVSYIASRERRHGSRPHDRDVRAQFDAYRQQERAALLWERRQRQQQEQRVEAARAQPSVDATTQSTPPPTETQSDARQ